MDTAKQLVIVDFSDIGDRRRRLIDLPNIDISNKINILKELEINTLICGAISRPLYRQLEMANIRIVPFIRGRIEEVIRAYENRELIDDRFRLPGCRGRGNHLGRLRCRNNRRTKRNTIEFGD